MQFIQATTPTYCRDCLRRRTQEAGRRWREQNREEAHLRKKRSHLKKYGITLAEYDAMLKRQGGGCAICGTSENGGRKLSVDHCHTVGTVRGLLCNRCNYALGQFDDRPELLKRAATYLESVA